MTTTKTTGSLAPGDVLDWGDGLTDRVISVVPMGGVVSKVNVSRRSANGRTVHTFFYAGIDAAHQIVDGE